MRAGGSVPNGRGIGKALGRLDSGTGLVTILVILQWSGRARSGRA
jgi:hypothetical protein